MYISHRIKDAGETYVVAFAAHAFHNVGVFGDAGSVLVDFLMYHCDENFDCSDEVHFKCFDIDRDASYYGGFCSREDDLELAV